jgi:hypothetical protein
MYLHKHINVQNYYGYIIAKFEQIFISYRIFILTKNSFLSFDQYFPELLKNKIKISLKMSHLQISKSWSFIINAKIH